jgi:hypothetical protein
MPLIAGRQARDERGSALPGFTQDQEASADLGIGGDVETLNRSADDFFRALGHASGDQILHQCLCSAVYLEQCL